MIDCFISFASKPWMNPTSKDVVAKDTCQHHWVRSKSARMIYTLPMYTFWQHTVGYTFWNRTTNSNMFKSEPHTYFQTWTVLFNIRRTFSNQICYIIINLFLKMFGIKYQYLSFQNSFDIHSLLFTYMIWNSEVLYATSPKTNKHNTHILKAVKSGLCNIK